MVYLREVIPDDLDLLYKWANDSVVRSNSFNPDLIPYKTHVKWFKKMMTEPSIIQFIMMDQDIPIGQIRLNVDGNDAEIGYSIAREYRGKGYGHRILQLVTDEIRKEYPEITRLIAKVKPGNKPSNRLFCENGFTMEYLFYSLKVDR